MAWPGFAVSFVKSLHPNAVRLHAPDVAFSPWRKHQTSRGRYTPNLWPVWLVAPLAVVLVLLLGRGIYEYAYDYFAQAAADQKPPEPVNVNDVLKATVTALTLVGAVLAGLYAYRKQLLAEGDAHRADASQLADRYTTAAEQLGHDQAAVRLAGVYALARLADDWEDQRQVCIDVLCAYLRMPYQPDSAGPGHKAGEREVRWTIIRVIRDHLRDPAAPASWCTYSLDFTGATFDGGDLSRSRFLGNVIFSGATFSGGTVNFDGVLFSGGRVNFHEAVLSGSTVTFSYASFSGTEFTWGPFPIPAGAWGASGGPPTRRTSQASSGRSGSSGGCHRCADGSLHSTTRRAGCAHPLQVLHLAAGQQQTLAALLCRRRRRRRAWVARLISRACSATSCSGQRACT
ncbi:pentapeptide repeat-containing protein [Streptomyces sp. NPDC032198]|uniref:pentapeptide repeat-containing protein n=1 Tax=Streptomyces sp. NPDC032198 TaxID=3155127 RepID=UPI0033CC3CB9